MRLCRDVCDRDPRLWIRTILRAGIMNMHRVSCIFLLAGVASAQQTVEVTHVVSKNVDRHVKLPGEFLPYLSVPIHAKVTGFVEDVKVDRGSEVKKGQVLATLVAPEMT